VLTVFVSVSRRTRALTVPRLFAKIIARATQQVGTERVSLTFLFISARAIKAKGLVETTAQFYTVLMTALRTEFVLPMGNANAMITSTV